MPNFEQPEDFGKEVESLELEIKSAKSYEELYEALEKAQVVEGSQKTYSVEELRGLIEEYRDGFKFNAMRRTREGDHEQRINKITNTLGIRDKVISLHKAEVKKEINGLK